MPDPHPSDPDNAHPVNRIALLTQFGLHEMVGVPTSLRSVGAAGYVVNLKNQPEVLKDIVPALARATRAEFRSPTISWEWVLTPIVTFVRREIESGRIREELRAEILPFIEHIGELADTAREAVEDALADRPMRVEKPHEP